MCSRYGAAVAIWTTSDVAIRRIAAAVPVTREPVESSADRFGMDEVRRLAASTGVWERRVAPNDVCASDLAVAAAERAIEDAAWPRESIDAILFVSQTPDYRLPATACCLQARLGMTKRCIAFDVNLGCSGYVYGLFLAAQLAGSGAARRVVLAVGDTVTKLVSPDDRATALLFGDAGSATLLEAEPGAPRMSFVLGTDGTGADHLIVRGGGARRPHAASFGLAEDGAEKGSCGADRLYMNGAEVFAFTLREVPPMITGVVELAGWSMDSLDLVVLHQANAAMLTRLTKKLGLPESTVPIALSDLGNTSSASIPVALCRRAGAVTGDLDRVVLGGFGVGFSWASAALRLAYGVVLPLLEIPEGPGGE